MSKPKQQKAGVLVPVQPPAGRPTTEPADQPDPSPPRAVAAVRQQAYDRMTPATKAVLARVTVMITGIESEAVVKLYRLGAELDEVADDRGGLYGRDAIDDIATYCNARARKRLADQLKHLRNFARAFSEEFVRANAVRKTVNGTVLGISHWLQVASVADQARREAMVEAAIAQALSVNDLKLQLAGNRGRPVPAGRKPVRYRSGRKPKPPSNLRAAVSQALAKTVGLRRLEDNLTGYLLPWVRDGAADLAAPGMLDRVVELQRTMEDVAAMAAAKAVAIREALTAAGHPPPAG